MNPTEPPTPAPRTSSLFGLSPITPPTPADTVSFYLEPADTSRVRGAILHTQAAEGARSLSQFIVEAVMEKVEALEEKYNGGEPFPSIGARELPPGRPMGV